MSNNVPGVMLEEHARELAAMPMEWKAYELKCFPPGEDELICFIVRGAVVPLKTRGKNKGHPDWKNMESATARTLYIKPDEHWPWLMDYEARTGQCFNCQGTGEEVAGWSVTKGVKHRTCSRCTGLKFPPFK
jgi:hypothetical protein